MPSVIHQTDNNTIYQYSINIEIFMIIIHFLICTYILGHIFGCILSTHVGLNDYAQFEKKKKKKKSTEYLQIPNSKQTDGGSKTNFNLIRHALRFCNDSCHDINSESTNFVNKLYKRVIKNKKNRRKS